jgi:hypothetical protein
VEDGLLELGVLAHLVELALAREAGLEELLGLPGLYALPLPLGDDEVAPADVAAGGGGEGEEQEAEADGQREGMRLGKKEEKE